MHDADTGLHAVTFCAVDVETTGGSPRACDIVEIGALRSRAGEPLGTFHSLVRPESEMPVEIQLLTGIRPTMLDVAPPLAAVLPSFLEFVRGGVFVAHNAAFDHAFLSEACRCLDYDPPPFEVLDTHRLSRRLLRGDVRDHRLATLAHHLRTTSRPCHRAFADAAACMEVLYALIERAWAYGVRTLGELLELQRASTSRHADKARLARDLPRSRGVYLFANARGETIYVGKATDLRARVRSYFVSEQRKRIADLRVEAASVRVIECATDLEALALEARLIERLRPRYNRRGVLRSKPAYVTMDMRERHARLRVARRPAEGAGLHIGPFVSSARARAAADTIAGLFGVRTCSLRIPDGASTPACSLYELGSCGGPCTGASGDVARHDDAVASLREDLLGNLAEARRRHADRLARLAGQSRFEEAAAHRDAFDELRRVVAQSRTLSAIAEAGRLVLDTEGGRVVLESGRLAGDRESDVPHLPGLEHASAAPDHEPLALALEGLEERKAIAAWLSRANSLSLVESERPFAYPWPPVRAVARIDDDDATVATGAPRVNA